MTQNPPRLAAWLVRQTVAPADRDAILGDFEEEFRARAARDGTRLARRWYWRQAVRSTPHHIRQRYERRHTGRPRAARPEVSLPLRPFQGTVQDVVRAVRALRATPAFTLVVLTVLALGIGATTAIYSVVDGVALRPLPYPRDDQLVVIAEPNVNTGRGSNISLAELHDWRSAQSTFEGIAASANGGAAFTAQNGDTKENFRVTLVSANLFPLLQAFPAMGRTFTPDEEVRGSNHVVILSDQCWRQRFAGRRDVIGQTISFENNGVWTIVGVMPPSFTYPAAATVPMDMWAPLPSQASDWARPKSGKFDVQGVGRLKPGVPLARAQADLDRITAPLRAESPQWFRNRGLTVTYMRDAIVGSARPWMLMLLGSVAFVLLLACVNVGNLLLARATTRARDAAVRSALGASRWRILRGLLIESLLLSVTGTVIGVCLATWGVEAIRAGLPARLPRLDEIAVNYRVLLAAAGVALAVALGVTPIWQTSPTFAATLVESGRSSGLGAVRSRARSILLAAEAALAVVLLVGAGLFVSSFVRLLRVDLGFETANVLSIDVSPPRGGKDPDFARVSAAIGDAGNTLRRVPGIESFALVSGTPPLLLGSDRKTVTVPGKPAFDGQDDLADAKLITADYFAVLRVPVLRGRAFSAEDAIAGAPATVILNDVAASRYFGQANPVGAAVLLDSSGSRTVVGVVRSVRLFGPEGELRPEIYMPFDDQHFDGNPILTMILRTSSGSASIGPSVREILHAALPGRPTPTVETYDELFGKLVAQRKFNMIVLALFGVLAITIAGTGIYGVMAYVVEQRTQEIGVRMALGADRSRVIAMVLRDAMRTLVVGLVIGLAGGWGLSRFVRAFLFQDDGHNPVVYVAAAACLIGAGLLAAVLPARRAARVDPVVALRAQ